MRRQQAEQPSTKTKQHLAECPALALGEGCDSSAAHLISEVVDGRKALSTTWRGSFSLLAAVMKISAHMVGLQERMKGPRYDVFGPWPVCPPHIAAQYP